MAMLLVAGLGDDQREMGSHAQKQKRKWERDQEAIGANECRMRGGRDGKGRGKEGNEENEMRQEEVLLLLPNNSNWRYVLTNQAIQTDRKWEFKLVTFYRITIGKSLGKNVIVFRNYSPLSPR